MKPSQKELAIELDILKEQFDKLNKLYQESTQDKTKSQSDQYNLQVRFNGLLEGLHSVAVQGYKKDGTTIYWNKASEKLYGYSSSEALGKSLFDLIIPIEMKEAVTQAVLLMTSTGKANEAEELQLMRKDGSKVSVYSSHSVLKNSNGDFELFCIDIDLSDIKTIQKELLLKSTILNSILESKSIGLFSLDNNYCYTSFNSTHALGMKVIYNADIELGKSIREYQYIDRDWEQAKQNIDKALAGETFIESAFSGDEELNRRYYEIFHQPVYDENNKIIGMSVFTVDNTDKKNAEIELQKSQATYREIFNSVTELIYIIDETGCFIDCNESVIQKYGYSKNEIIGNAPDFLSAPGKNDDKQIAAKIVEAFHGNAQNFEFWGISKNGYIFPKEVSLSKGFYYGQPVVIAVGRDISERKRIDDALVFLLKQSYTDSGNSFFDLLSKYLAENLNMDYICIDKLAGDLLSAETVSIYFDGQYESNVQYQLKDTPCGDVVGNTICCFEKDVRHLFPNDEILQDMLAESYLGTTLWSSTGKAIGLIAMISRQPLEERYVAETVLKFVAVRAAGELERMFAEEALLKSEEKYRALVNNSFESILILSLEGKILFANNASLKLLEGDNTQDVIGKNVFEFLAPESLPKAIIDFQNVAQGIDSYVSEYSVFTLKGNPKWIESIGKIVEYEGETADLISISDITERKETQAELMLSHQTFSDVIQSIPSGLFIYQYEAPDKFILMLGNKKAEEMTNIQINQWIGYEISEIGLFNDDLNLKKRYLEVIINNINFEIDDVYFSNNQLSKYFRIMAFNIPGDRLGVSIQDITHIKTAENSLKESEERYRTIVEGILSGIVIHVNNKIVFANQSAIDLVGELNQNSIYGKSIFDYVHPEDKMKVLNAIKASASSDSNEAELKQNIIKERLIALNGDVIHIEASAIRINYYGDPALMVMLNDISKRYSAEQALIASENKFRSYIEYAPDGIFIIDENGSFIEVNSAGCLLCGYDDQEILSMKVFDLLDDSEFKNANELYSIFQNDGNCFGELSFQNKNGTLFFALLSAVKIEENRILVFAKNIDQIKNTENELIEAKEKAEESDRLKSAFIANMSHEIRTPLNGIMGFSYFLVEPNLNENERLEYANVLRSSCNRLLSTVNNILDISRIDAGLMEVVSNQVNLYSLLYELFTLHNSNFAAKGLQLELNLDKDLENIEIMSDEQKIYQILNNLLNNAFKFTNKGIVKFGFEKKDKYLEFFVEDTGIGVSVELQDFIFGRFNQEDISFSRNHEGSGLGLAISKGLVELLGGQMYIKSKKNIGSKFMFTVPIIKSLSVKSYANAIKIDNNKILFDFSHLNILVVEDDFASYMFVDKILTRKTKAKVIRAENGFAAWELFNNHKDISLILMDIKIPGIDGFELTTKIRSQGSSVPIIAATAFAMSGDKDRVLKAGCNDYIAKPIDPDELIEKIKKLTFEDQ